MGSVLHCLFRTCCEGSKPNNQLEYPSAITPSSNRLDSNNAGSLLTLSSSPSVAIMFRDSISAATSAASRVFHQNESNNITMNDMIMDHETSTFLAAESPSTSGGLLFRSVLDSNNSNSHESISSNISHSHHSGLARTETDVSTSNSHDEEQDDPGTDCCQPAPVRNATSNPIMNSQAPRQQLQSVHDFFRRLRDRWQHSSYDSFEALSPPTPPTSFSSSVVANVRGAANSSNNIRTSISSSIHQRHTDRNIRAHSRNNEVSHRTGTMGDDSFQSSQSRKSTKTMNSPLRQAVSYNTRTSDDIPTISAAEIVLPGSLLQKEMAMRMLETLASVGDECVICMEGFDDTNPRMPTLCGCGENKTYFHLPCLYQWIDKNNNCPTCRESLTWQEF